MEPSTLSMPGAGVYPRSFLFFENGPFASVNATAIYVRETG